jgi:hypothetical protein
MSKEEIPRKRGGQIGNQNARKHGFYSRFLDKTERQNIIDASSMEGIDEEIAILRVKLLSVLAKDPENISLILRAVETLARLLRIKYHLRKFDGNQLQTAIGNVIREIALPIGARLKEEPPYLEIDPPRTADTVLQQGREVNSKLDIKLDNQ